jgi:hypothetical protein
MTTRPEAIIEQKVGRVRRGAGAMYSETCADVAQGVITGCESLLIQGVSE